MAGVKAGDRVRIVQREQTADDVKSSLYFPHYAGLTGSVQKAYVGDEVAVQIELESLTREIRKRHDSVRDQMKTKWLDGLSEEGRGKLTEREKDFNLRYIVLVTQGDLEAVGPKPIPAPKAAPAPKEEVPLRPTDQDYAAAEEQELLRRLGTSSSEQGGLDL